MFSCGFCEISKTAFSQNKSGRLVPLKIRLWTQHAIHGSLARETQTLILNFSIGIGDMIKDQFVLFSFPKMWKYSSMITKEGKYLRWQLIVKISLHKKWSFPLRISPVNVTKSDFPADLVTFTGEILNEKLDFCAAYYALQQGREVLFNTFSLTSKSYHLAGM